MESTSADIPTHPQNITELVKKLLREHKHPAPFLPNGGMRVSLRESMAADSSILWWPREKQAKYADMVVVAIADDAALCRQVGIGKEWGEGDLNSCAVGGLAYLALHSTDPEIRDWCEKTLRDKASKPKPGGACCIS